MLAAARFQMKKLNTMQMQMISRINSRDRTPDMKFYFWVLKIFRGMYLVSNLAVLPTIGDWPSTLRAGGKSPTELSSSSPSFWVAAQALDRQSLCKQAGQSLEMVPATMARVPAESAGQR